MGYKIFAFLIFLTTLGCELPDRHYRKAIVPTTVVGDLPSKAGYTTAEACPPSAPTAIPTSDPYEACLVRDCELHACQLGGITPEVPQRCGISQCYVDDGLLHAQCPQVVGVSTELKVCGGDEPPREACFVYGPPIMHEYNTAYCCTPDGAALPSGSSCAQDSDCNALINYCQYAQCWDGQCRVNFLPDGSTCNLDPLLECWDGVCQPEAGGPALF